MKKWLIIGGIVVLLLSVLIPWLLIANNWLDEARDLAIIVLAIFHLISITLLIILIAAVVVLVNELRNAKESIEPKVNEVLENIKGISNNAKVTSTTAKQTASYIAEGVVSPVIKAAGLMAGIKAGAKTLAQRNATKTLPVERVEHIERISE